jgi:hypothetical protein
MTRDGLKQSQWFDQWIAFAETAVSDSIATIAEPSKNPNYRPQYIWDLAFYNLKIAMRRYSRGDNVDALPKYIEPLLFYWEQSERLGKEVWSANQQHGRHSWAQNLDFYIESFWLVGLALSLDVPETQWTRLISLVGNEGEDLLLDRIIATRSPSRRIGTTLCYPKPYARLLKAIDAAPNTQKNLLTGFVEHWYPEIGRAAKSGREAQAVPYKEPYWYNYHRIEGGYFGFWCIEAVAAVKAFGLDDSLCVGHPNYPGDLLRPGKVTAPDLSRLLPALAATIGQPPQKPFTGEPLKASGWELFKLMIKNKWK